MFNDRFIPVLLVAISLGTAAGRIDAQDLSEVFEDLGVPWWRQDRPEKTEPDDEPIETDRDSFTPATTTVKSGRLVYESSYSFIENRQTANTNSFPEMITRIGISDRVELRVGWNYETGGGGAVSNGDAGGEEQEAGTTRDSQMLYGVKIEVTKQRGWVPQSACIVQATSPTSGPEPSTDPQVAYVAGWKILEKYQVDSSLRYSATEEKHDHYNLWAPSTVIKFPVARQWYAHAEYFGIFSDGKAVGKNQQYLSPGIHYLISPNCEVGVRVGWGLNQDSADFFSNVGVGFRF